MAIVNTRVDLDAISGTPEYDGFMSMLRGSLWRLEKDDTARAWIAVEDNSTIERFGFSRSDFPDAQPPEPPTYTLPLSKAQRIAAVTAEYSAHMAELRDAWLAAAVADGENETAAKATITQSVAERKAEFIADVAAIRASTS